MLALEISLNGKRICVAASTPNKVMSTGVSWTFRQPDQWRFNIGGIVGDESNRHFYWATPDLTVNDEIVIRLVETEMPTAPDVIYDPADYN